MKDGQHAKPARNKPDPSQEEGICGLDVEPEVAFREGRNEKENMKKLPIAMLAISLTAAMSASASLTISGSDFNNSALVASYNGTYVPGSPGYMALGYASPDVDAVVGVKGPLGTLNALNMSFTYGNLQSSGNDVPFAAFGVSLDGTWGAGGQEFDIISEQGNQLYGNTLVHVWDFSLNNGDGGDVAGLTDVTLGYVLGVANGYNGVAFGDLEVMRAYAYVGDEGASNGSADIYSITVTTVPEPTTMIAGALLLLPFGASTLRILRKSRAA